MNRNGDDQNPRKGAEFFRQATEAMATENWGKAAELVEKSLKCDPENVMFQQTLRGLKEKLQQDK